MKTGVLAARVKNLFPAPATEARPPEARAPGEGETPSPAQPADTLPLPNPAAAVTPGDEVPSPEAAEPPGGPRPAEAITPPSPPSSESTGPTAPVKATPARGASGRPPEPPRKRRAVALKGALLVSQDGEYVHYRKKCVDCGFEGGCRTTMRIGIGLTRAHFFCPKWRKRRDVQIQGSMQ